MDDPRLKKTDFGYLEVVNKPTLKELNAYYANKYYQQSMGSYEISYNEYELKYIKSRGPAAHRARIETELLLTEQKIDDVLSYYRAMAKVGLGRDLTAFLKPISR